VGNMAIWWSPKANRVFRPRSIFFIQTVKICYRDSIGKSNLDALTSRVRTTDIFSPDIVKNCIICVFNRESFWSTFNSDVVSWKILASIDSNVCAFISWERSSSRARLRTFSHSISTNFDIFHSQVICVPRKYSTGVCSVVDDNISYCDIVVTNFHSSVVGRGSQDVNILDYLTIIGWLERGFLFCETTQNFTFL
jgi:hypothetical protein